MQKREKDGQFRLLQDAAVFTGEDSDEQALIYLESGKEAVKVSRGQFRSITNGYAQVLREIGINKSDLVIIAHPQDLEAIFIFWGAIMIGAIPSIFPTLTEKLDPEVYNRSMAELVRLSGARAILTTDDFADDLVSIVECPVFGSSRLKTEETANPEVKLYRTISKPGDIAFLQHSSGTTGLQKGVALSHESVINQLNHYSKTIDLNQDDVIISWLPLYHDMGLIAGFILPLFSGIPLVLMSPFEWVRNPAMLLKAIDKYHGTLCWLPNFAYNHCARRIRERDIEGISLTSMRMFINCSEPVYDESHQIFLSRFAKLGLRPGHLGVSYAMAENTFAVTQTTPNSTLEIDVIDRQILEEERRATPIEPENEKAVIKVSCGRPIEGTVIKVIDDRGIELTERQVGQIAIQSDCMLSEYYKRPDLDPFDDGWYLSGDMGYLADGRLFIVGRTKDLIINAGKNIYPQDIEAIVNEVQGVHPGRAVAFGVFDQREGTELITVVAEVAVDDDSKRRGIAKEIRRRVAQESMVVVTYVKLVNPKWLIKTSSGKAARSANREKWLKEHAGFSTGVS